MPDYSEIRGTPADPLFALREYARGYMNGHCKAESEDAFACDAEGDAIVLLEALGISSPRIRILFEVSRREVRTWDPNLDGVEVRAVAARRILSTTLRSITRRLEAIA